MVVFDDIQGGIRASAGRIWQCDESGYAKSASLSYAGFFEKGSKVVVFDEPIAGLMQIRHEKSCGWSRTTLGARPSS